MCWWCDGNVTVMCRCDVTVIEHIEHTKAQSIVVVEVVVEVVVVVVAH